MRSWGFLEEERNISIKIVIIHNTSAEISPVGEKSFYLALEPSIELYFLRNCMFLAKR